MFIRKINRGKIFLKFVIHPPTQCTGETHWLETLPTDKLQEEVKMTWYHRPTVIIENSSTIFQRLNNIIRFILFNNIC